MPDKSAFITFLVASCLLNLAPGPDMLYVMGRSIGQGRKAGIVSALGIFAGTLVHITLAAIGLTAVLRSSPVAFNIIRYAGVAYLVYLGVRLLVQRNSQLGAANLPQVSLRSVFSQGVLTNVLNPKVALFFLAFLPQFVNAHSGNTIWNIVSLGMIFNTGGALVNLAVAGTGGFLGNALRRNPRIGRIQQRFTGAIFLGLGLRLGFSHR
ncbi:MAG: LysE family translocator [Terriglobales bacterium]